jgi:plastocyanin
MVNMTRKNFGAPALLLIAAAVVLSASPAAHAQDTVTLSIANKDHKFDPAELHAPANKTISVRIKNLDPIAMEFESKDLHFEKIVAAKGEGVVFIRPQKPGRYVFFDDFHQDTQGTLVVE